MFTDPREPTKDEALVAEVVASQEGATDEQDVRAIEYSPLRCTEECYLARIEKQIDVWRYQQCQNKGSQEESSLFVIYMCCAVVHG